MMIQKILILSHLITKYLYSHAQQQNQNQLQQAANNQSAAGFKQKPTPPPKTSLPLDRKFSIFTCEFCEQQSYK
jgi:hypothetical protein